MRACRELFGHDGRRDERQRIDRRRHIAQRIELFICRCQITGLPDDRNADLLYLLQELLCRERRFVAGDGFELIDRAARVTEPAPGHFCHLAAEARDDRRQNQRRLVAHAAGGVLVYRLCAKARQIDRVARAHHRVGQDCRFMVGHALVENCHCPGRHLVVGNFAFCKAVDDKADFLVG